MCIYIYIILYTTFNNSIVYLMNIMYWSKIYWIEIDKNSLGSSDVIFVWEYVYVICNDWEHLCLYILVIRYSIVQPGDTYNSYID